MGKRIVPCLDMKGGEVVKGVAFKELLRAGDPVTLACAYERQGANELVFLDISATTSGRDILIEELKKVKEAVRIPLITGGGINNLETIQKVLELGVERVSLNSAAVRQPSLIKEAVNHFGEDRIIIAIDAKKINGSWEVMINGGQKKTGLDVLEWARAVADMGVKEVLLTSIHCDGKKEGYDNQLNRAVHRVGPLSVIASGGAGHPQHLYQALTDGEADAVLLASILHFKEYTIQEIRAYLRERGVDLEDGPHTR